VWSNRGPKDKLSRTKGGAPQGGGKRENSELKAHLGGKVLNPPKPQSAKGTKGNFEERAQKSPQNWDAQQPG